MRGELPTPRRIALRRSSSLLFAVNPPSLRSIVSMSTLSEQIAAHPFFTVDVSALPFDERVALAYQRAILILRTYSIIALTLLLITC